MNSFEANMDDMGAVLFDEFGEDATVQRGTGAPVPVRVFVNRGVQRAGDYGQVLGRVSTVSFRNSEWQPAVGDTLVLATGTRKVGQIEADDGFVTEAVLNG